MRRRTNVMIEVEEDVFLSIVEPHKRNKTFSKLISSLLNGYISDGYIRAFVDDNLEEVRKAVVGSFEDSVGEMESVLANMGLFTDELGAHAQAGYSKFQQRRAQQAEELDKDTFEFTPRVNQPETGSKKVDDLEKKVNSIERNMTEGFNRILDVLNKMSFTPVSTPEADVKPKMEVEISDIVRSKAMGIPESKPVSIPEPIVVPATNWQGSGEEDVYNDIVEDEDVEESVANSFLTSLISDFGGGY